MKNKRYIKHVMGEFGYNMDSDIILTATDNTGYIYFTDEQGNQLKVKYDSVVPINVDPTNWDYEGILTSGTYDVLFGYFEFEDVGGTVQYGSIDPLDTNINIFVYFSDEMAGFSANTLIFKLNNNYRSTLDEININIDGELYNVVEKYFDRMGFAYIIENVMVNPLTVGNHDIKVRYGELIPLSDNTEIEINGTSEIIETIDNNNHYIQLFNSGVSYQEIMDDIKSTDESSQIYSFYSEGVLITDLSLIFSDGSYLRVTAENGVTAEYMLALPTSSSTDIQTTYENIVSEVDNTGLTVTVMLAGITTVGQVRASLASTDNSVQTYTFYTEEGFEIEDNGQILGGKGEHLIVTAEDGVTTAEYMLALVVFIIGFVEMKLPIGVEIMPIMLETVGSNYTPIVINVSSGNLPKGLTLANNAITGTPTNAGGGSFGLRATDADDNLSEEVIIHYSVFDVLAWDMGGDLPAATVGEPYSIQLLATGGRLPYTFSLVEGSGLPEGLSIEQDRLEGDLEPKGEGEYEFTLRVTDNNGATADLLCGLKVVAGASSNTELAVVTPIGENYISLIDNMNDIISVKVYGTTTYQNILDSIRSADGSVQTYVFLPLSMTPITGQELLDPADESSRLRVTAEDGVSIQDYSLSDAKELKITTESLATVFIGTARVDSVELVADLSKSLQGKYFTLTTQQGTEYYIWFNAGTGTDPKVGTKIGIEVVYTENDSADTLGGLIVTALTTPLNGVCNVSYKTGILSINQIYRGAIANVSAENSGFICTTPTAGVNASAYSDTLTAANGVTPYVFTVSQGLLPAGLSLNTNGMITGTCTTETPASIPIIFSCVDAEAVEAHRQITFIVTDGSPA